MHTKFRCVDLGLQAADSVSSSLTPSTKIRELLASGVLYRDGFSFGESHGDGQIWGVHPLSQTTLALAASSMRLAGPVVSCSIVVRCLSQAGDHAFLRDLPEDTAFLGASVKIP